MTTLADGQHQEIGEGTAGDFSVFSSSCHIFLRFHIMGFGVALSFKCLSNPRSSLSRSINGRMGWRLDQRSAYGSVRGVFVLFGVALGDIIVSSSRMFVRCILLVFIVYFQSHDQLSSFLRRFQYASSM